MTDRTTTESPALATFEHLERLLAKRHKLDTAIRDSVAALGPQLARETWTAEELGELHRRSKAHPGPKYYLTDTLATFTGVDQRLITWHSRHPQGWQLTGTLPLRRDPGLPLNGTATVYLLLDDDNSCLYVGTSSQVNNRLRAHMKEGRIPATRYEVIVCETGPDAYRLEGDLIFQHKPPYNRAGVARRRAA